MQLIALEEQVTERIRKAGKSRYAFWYAVAVYGILLFPFFAALFTLRGWFFDWGEFVLLILCSYAIVNILQHLIKRKRPNFEVTTQYKMWRRTYSLPSGHATGSAVAATFILMNTHFPDTVSLGIFVVLGILLALSIAVSRLVVGVHHLFDVLVGLVLGTLLALGYSLFVL